MKTKQFKKHRARIRKLAKKWIGPLGLAWWTVELHCFDSAAEFLKAHGSGKADEDRILMRVYSDWRYRTATIAVNVPLVKERSAEQLEHGFVHELMHIFLGEMRMTCAEPDFSDHEERTAKTLADAFLWVQRKAQ